MKAMPCKQPAASAKACNALPKSPPKTTWRDTALAEGLEGAHPVPAWMTPAQVALGAGPEKVQVPMRSGAAPGTCSQEAWEAQLAQFEQRFYTLVGQAHTARLKNGLALSPQVELGEEGTGTVAAARTATGSSPSPQLPATAHDVGPGDLSRRVVAGAQSAEQNSSAPSPSGTSPELDADVQAPQSISSQLHSSTRVQQSCVPESCQWCAEASDGPAWSPHLMIGTAVAAPQGRHAGIITLRGLRPMLEVERGAGPCVLLVDHSGELSLPSASSISSEPPRTCALRAWRTLVALPVEGLDVYGAPVLIDVSAGCHFFLAEWVGVGGCLQAQEGRAKCRWVPVTDAVRSAQLNGSRRELLVEAIRCLSTSLYDAVMQLPCLAEESRPDTDDVATVTTPLRKRRAPGAEPLPPDL